MGWKLGDLFRGFAGGEAEESAAEAVEYEGYSIRPAPRRDGTHWLTAGVISKTFEDGVKEHHFIRAETHGSRDEAEAFAVLKGKQIVDDFADRMFKDR